MTFPQRNSLLKNLKHLDWRQTLPLGIGRSRMCWKDQLAVRFKIDWQTKDGKTKSAAFTRFWNQRQLGFSSQRPDKISIIKIDAFTQSVALEFTKALPKMVDGADGIILDLRANGGGDAEAMADVASLFLEDGTGLGKFVDRSGASFELHTYLKRLWPSAAAVNLPVVVLTSESTSSAAEIMAAALQTNRRAHGGWDRYVWMCPRDS